MTADNEELLHRLSQRFSGLVAGLRMQMVKSSLCQQALQEECLEDVKLLWKYEIGNGKSCPIVYRLDLWSTNLLTTDCSRLLWFLPDVIGLFSIIVVSFSLNVGRSAPMFSINVVPKTRMLSVPTIYVIGPLQ